MIREITGNIYKVRFDISRHNPRIVECDNLNDLFDYLMNKKTDGWTAISINEICIDGSTPRVAFKSNKEYQKRINYLKN